jgi:multisubunit Na+/H+ antiporter MnhG subunit
MLHRIDVGDPEVLMLAGGRGCRTAIAAPLLLIGVLGMATIFIEKDVSAERETRSEDSPYLVLIPALPMTLLGLWLLLGGKGFKADLHSRTVATWWGILGLRREKTLDLDSFNAVSVVQEIRRSSKNNYTTYPVSLLGEGTKLKVAEHVDSDSARRLAEVVAKFVDLNLVDRTAGVEIVREPGSIDESLRERNRRQGRKVEIPPRPTTLRSDVRIGFRSLSAMIPPTGFTRRHRAFVGGAMLVLGVLAGIFAVAVSVDKDPIDWRVVASVAAFLVLLMAAFLGHAVWTATRRATIEATSDRLQVTEKGFLRNRTTEISTRELEELRIVDAAAAGGQDDGSIGKGSGHITPGVLSGSAIMARSDLVAITFGHGLSEEELRWLAAEIEKVVTA